MKSEGLTLQQFVEILNKHLEYDRKQPWDIQKVAIPLAEPSIGASAITYVSRGFDWDKGTLLLSTEEPLVRACKINKTDALEYAQKIVDYYSENKQFHHLKKDVWLDGFMSGLKYGSRKLLEENDEL